MAKYEISNGDYHLSCGSRILKEGVRIIGSRYSFTLSPTLEKNNARYILDHSSDIVVLDMVPFTNDNQFFRFKNGKNPAVGTPPKISDIKSVLDIARKICLELGKHLIVSFEIAERFGIINHIKTSTYNTAMFIDEMRRLDSVTIAPKIDTSYVMYYMASVGYENALPYQIKNVSKLYHEFYVVDDVNIVFDCTDINFLDGFTRRMNSESLRTLEIHSYTEEYTDKIASEGYCQLSESKEFLTTDFSNISVVDRRGITTYLNATIRLSDSTKTFKNPDELKNVFLHFTSIPKEIDKLEGKIEESHQNVHEIPIVIYDNFLDNFVSHMKNYMFFNRHDEETEQKGLFESNRYRDRFSNFDKGFSIIFNRIKSIHEKNDKMFVDVQYKPIDHLIKFIEDNWNIIET